MGLLRKPVLEARKLRITGQHPGSGGSFKAHGLTGHGGGEGGQQVGFSC